MCFLILAFLVCVSLWLRKIWPLLPIWVGGWGGLGLPVLEQEVKLLHKFTTNYIQTSADKIM